MSKESMKEYILPQIPLSNVIELLEKDETKESKIMMVTNSGGFQRASRYAMHLQEWLEKEFYLMEELE